MRIIGGHNTDYRQVNAINGIMSPEFPQARSCYDHRAYLHDSYPYIRHS